MKALVKLGLLCSFFITGTAFAATFSYKCVDQENSRNAYFQIKEKAFLSSGHFLWSWDYPDFENSLFKFKLSQQYEEFGRICFKNEYNILLIYSKTDYCLSPEMLSGGQLGSVTSSHKGGNVIESTGSNKYHFACVRE
jgi:hypothetical protein